MLCKILSAQSGRHVWVANFIVNNNPKTMKLRRRSFRTAASWSFARAHAPRLASFGQNARWVCFAKMRRPSPSSFETRVRRARIRGISSACALLRMRTTEVAARCPTVFGNSHLTMSNSPSRSRGAFFTPGVCNFASPTRIEGWAERRETFGCVRSTR